MKLLFQCIILLSSFKLQNYQCFFCIRYACKTTDNRKIIQSEVLEEIISVLICKQLISDLMKPQATYNHDSVRGIIEDVTQSSAMRLDPVSMSKLWDLITMVFKWQVSMSDNAIGITLRHLYEIENYVINPDTHQQLLRVQTLVENFGKVLDKKEQTVLHEEIFYWLRDYNVRVSLLLRMGLQSVDGNFVMNNLDPVAEEMLKNLGENIYQVTQNGRILENRRNRNDTTTSQPPPPTPSVDELEHFVHEILGQRQRNTENAEGSRFKLTISDENANRAREKRVAFENFDLKIDDNKLHDFMGDLSIKDDEEQVNFKEELLNMIGGEDEQK